MSILVTCSNCRRTLDAPDAAAGRRVKCPACGTILSVPDLPDAVPVALEQPASPERPVPASFTPVARDQAVKPARTRASTNPPELAPAAELSPWFWRGLGIGAFVAICVFFGFIGAAMDPDDPGVGGLRMARKVGAPIALLLIAAFEVVMWLRKSARSKEEQGDRSPDRRRRS
jgi:LSD1 subclass zinc finger protein